jgi:hypothetical protein
MKQSLPAEGGFKNAPANPVIQREIITPASAIYAAISKIKRSNSSKLYNALIKI